MSLMMYGHLNRISLFWRLFGRWKLTVIMHQGDRTVWTGRLKFLAYAFKEIRPGPSRIFDPLEVQLERR